MSVDPMQEVVERIKTTRNARISLTEFNDIVEQAYRSGAEWMRGEAARVAAQNECMAASLIESLPLLPEGKKEPK